MKILCINCAEADLERASVRLSGEIRKHPYTVEMEGLKCPNCGYSTVDSKSMVELGRAAADEYRRAHGLLTSDEIVALRHKFGDSQDAFAKRIGVGVASIKRWELGKIQDKLYNDLILQKTRSQDSPIVASVNQTNNLYQCMFAGTGNTVGISQSFGTTVVSGISSNLPNIAESVTSVCTFVANSGPAIRNYVTEMAARYGCSTCKNTAGRYDFAPHTTKATDASPVPLFVGGSYAR